MNFSVVRSLSQVHGKPAGLTAAVRTLCVALCASLPFAAPGAVLSGAPIALSINNVAPGGLLGWSAAVSADGRVAAGGAPATNRSGTGGTDYTGAAYVYTQANGVWSDPVTLSTSGIPSEGQLGESIAVAANGQQVFVGAPDLNTYTGAVYIYTQANGSWSNTPTRTSLTLPSGVTTYYSFGFALATSADGQTLAVGASHSASGGNSPGGIYVYTLSAGTWGNATALPMGTIPNGAEIGTNVAVSSNGTVIIAGGKGVNSGVGEAYVWRKSNGTWSNPVALSVPASAGSGAQFGNAVALSSDGSVALVGAPGADSPYGAAYVYSYVSGSWSTTPVTLDINTANTNSFGYSLAISPDGQAAFIGVFNQSTGAVYMSVHSGSSWGTAVSLSTANVPPASLIGAVVVAGDEGEEVLTSGETANANTGGLWAYMSPATVSLAAAASPPAVAPGASLTFNLTLTNSDQPGSTSATTLNDVVLTDTLPAGTTYVSSNAANGSCSHSGATVSCTLTSLAPGNNSQNPWTPSITVSTPATAAVLSNALTVSSNEPLLGTTSVTTQVTNDVAPTVNSGNLSTATNTAVSGTLSATPGYSGQVLTFSIVSQPSNGSVILTNAATGAVTYTPDSGFSGVDTFVWTAGDGIVSATPAAESITVGGSSGGGSGSSGKSGGGGLGIVSLLVLFGGILKKLASKDVRKEFKQLADSSEA